MKQNNQIESGYMENISQENLTLMNQKYKSSLFGRIQDITKTKIEETKCDNKELKRIIDMNPGSENILNYFYQLRYSELASITL